MERTSVMVDGDVLERLKAMARDRGVSFASVAREALEAKAAEYRPRPRSLGSGNSGESDVSSQAGVGRSEPRS